MKFDLSNIPYTKKDLQKGIVLPSRLDTKLAHFIGIHLGDGNLRKINERKDYRMTYNGHSINEKHWYDNYLSNLIHELFNLKVITKKGHNTVKIEFTSKAIYFFLNKKCGLPSGPKENCDIPEIIKNADLEIKKAFIMGLADTDFSLVFKNRHKNINYYPVIDYQTSNKTLRNSVIGILTSMGFRIYANERIQERCNKFHKSYYFQINGTESFNKWMKEIGFTNDNQLTKIEVWKKLGFLPPKTDINQRIKLLEK